MLMQAFSFGSHDINLVGQIQQDISHLAPVSINSIYSLSSYLLLCLCYQFFVMYLPIFSSLWSLTMCLDTSEVVLKDIKRIRKFISQWKKTLLRVDIYLMYCNHVSLALNYHVAKTGRSPTIWYVLLVIILQSQGKNENYTVSVKYTYINYPNEWVNWKCYEHICVG